MENLNRHFVRLVVPPCHFNLILLGGLLMIVPPAVFAQGVTFLGTPSAVGFGKVNLCQAGQNTPLPCSKTLSLSYKVTQSGSLGAVKVLTKGSPNLDFTLAGVSTCTGQVTIGATCTVNVEFMPALPGDRAGVVQITDTSGNVLATTPVYGSGVGPQIRARSH
jgi:hypothetical protein